MDRVARQALLGFLVGLFFVPTLQAQNKLGLAAGMNFASFSVPEQQIDLNRRSGFTLAGIFDFVINRRFAVRVAPSYIQKGAKQSFINDRIFGSGKATFRTAYFEVPVFLKVVFAPGNLQPYALVGPQVGFNTSSQLEVVGAGGTTVSDIEGAIKLFDLGIGVGSGVSIPIAKYSVFVEGRYVFGVLNISSGDIFRGDELGLGDEIRNSGIQIMAGFTF